MADYKVVTAANLIFEAAGDPHLHQDCLWKFILHLDHSLHEVMTIRVELMIDLKDGLLVLFVVKDDGTVTARDNFLLLSDTLDE